MSNDDMDDMMRKAADEYELNHEMASDWNKVQAGIHQPEQPFIVEPEQKKRKRYLLFLWFLLIPALLIIAFKMNFFTASSLNNQKKTIETAATKLQSEKLTGKKQANDFNKNLINDNASFNHLKTFNGKRNFKIQPGNKYIATQNFSASNPGLYNNQNSIAPDSFIADSKQKESNNNPDKSAGNNPLIINNSNENKNDKQVINNADQSDKISKKSLSKVVTDTAASTSAQTENTKIDSLKNVNKDSVINVSSKQKNKISNYTRQAFAYAGIMANADVSFIKNQKTSSAAFGAGIAGGYHFKNGISIETGLVYDRKNYYTKGKYFNTDKLSYLQNVQLLATNGNCYMYEIPLNVVYDFKSHKKFSWFVSAGASSYLMHKEYYNFKYNYNGSYGERSYNYYHTSKDWFAILNVGAGVNIQTSDKYFIKVQPYYKAPLSGVGIGSLPLRSAGINFSLVRRIP